MSGTGIWPTVILFFFSLGPSIIADIEILDALDLHSPGEYQEKIPLVYISCTVTPFVAFFFQLCATCYQKHRVYLSVKTCEGFLCFVAIVRVRVYYVDFFVFFVQYVTGECYGFYTENA